MVKHILLFGGNGRTGREVIKRALERGIGVTALVRNASSITQNAPLLRVVQGNPMNAEDVEHAIEGADAVVSTLNNGRTSDMPWAKVTSPVDLMEVSIKNAIASMKARNIPRIATLSAGGVGDSFDDAPWIMRVLIKKTNMKQAYDDHNKVDEALRASGLAWTQARAMGLTNKPHTGEIVHSYANDPKPGMTISRAGVAAFLLDSLSDPAMIGKAPVISEK